MNTHYAVIVSSVPPMMTLVAAGPELAVKEQGNEYVRRHPLNSFEELEILTREPDKVRDPAMIRNVAIMGHPQSGKTELARQVDQAIQQECWPASDR